MSFDVPSELVLVEKEQEIEVAGEMKVMSERRSGSCSGVIR
jgi:hypothetical protein